MKLNILDIMPISLSQGLYALVDGEDYPFLVKYKWYAHKIDKNVYAKRYGKGNKKIAMHRDIMKPLPNFQVDHINGGGLDNRKQNLRIATSAQNKHNQKIRKTGSSQYKGVCWDKDQNKWRASIRHNKKSIYLGLFNTQIKAAKAYDQKARELFGEFAHTNI